MSNPYASSDSSLAYPAPGLGVKVFAWIAGILYAFPLVGFVGIVLQFVRVFSGLAASDNADPAILAQEISVALLVYFWGGVFFIVGFVMVMTGHYGLKIRNTSYYRSLKVISIFWCVLFFPVGLVF